MPLRTRMNPSLRAALFGLALALSVPAAHAAGGEWYFYVENHANSRIVKLQVSEDGRDWGDFDLAGGIAPGKVDKLIWDASTDDENCRQWIRARFADGSTSTPAKFNFCKNLDDPIVFE